jgi:hypothetical protein
MFHRRSKKLVLAAMFSTMAVTLIGTGILLYPSVREYLAWQKTIPWQEYSFSSFERLLSEERSQFVVFVGNWDTSTRYDLNLSMRPEIRVALRSKDVVPVIADCTNDSPDVNALFEFFGNEKHMTPFAIPIRKGDMSSTCVFDGGFYTQKERDRLLESLDGI